MRENEETKKETHEIIETVEMQVFDGWYLEVSQRNIPC